LIDELRRTRVCNLGFRCNEDGEEEEVEVEVRNEKM